MQVMFKHDGSPEHVSSVGRLLQESCFGLLHEDESSVTWERVAAPSSYNKIYNTEFAFVY